MPTHHRAPRDRGAALLAFLLLAFSGAATALEPGIEQLGDLLEHSRRRTCEKIGSKLGSVSIDDCLRSGLRSSAGASVEGLPIMVREIPAAVDREPLGRILLFGGIHGDEYSSVSIVFRWLELFDETRADRFHWRVVPVLNPDGLLRPRSRRMNANGVDLNRNFPCPDWERATTEYWIRRTQRNPRRFPGTGPLSEPESRFLASEIRHFRPDVIVAVHAPHSVVDFDGPPEAPERLGSLYLKLLGTYPGSLGRWAGVHLNLPVLTIELPSAGIMPSAEEQRRMWSDLVGWLERRMPQSPTSEAMTGR